ncbi:MAG: O-antigen ligase family protein [Acidobacteria bacterium]|nr:O-antigen ligase family protein [Acidobacteriota bacterium]
MIRLSLLALCVSGLALYAFKDWYRSLCGLILLMAVVEHPDMPKGMVGISGLNPWNILLAFVVLGWVFGRQREGLSWDFPRPFVVLLALYLGAIGVATLRLIAAPSGLLGDPPFSYIVGEFVINTFKWILPGLLLYDGARSKERLHLALLVVVGVYLLLAVQVIRWMPLMYAFGSGADLERRALKILSNEVGYHRVNLSMMLAGASWAVLAAGRVLPLAFLRFPTFLGVSFGMALTGGRMGYVTWAAVGLIIGALRWRKILVIIPIAALLLVSTVPAARERLLMGFAPETRDTSQVLQEKGVLPTVPGDGPDAYTVTSGRTVIWPFVVEKILQRPIVGYGREAMMRTGLGVWIYQHFNEIFPHPHNAYLQILFDGGLVAFTAVMLFFGYVLRLGVRLFRNRQDAEAAAVGGMLLALVLALLVASMGSQTFYPREGAVGMWCAIGLALRVAGRLECARPAVPPGSPPVSPAPKGPPAPPIPERPRQALGEGVFFRLAGRRGAGGPAHATA